MFGFTINTIIRPLFLLFTHQWLNSSTTCCDTTAWLTFCLVYGLCMQWVQWTVFFKEYPMVNIKLYPLSMSSMARLLFMCLCMLRIRHSLPWSGLRPSNMNNGLRWWLGIKAAKYALIYFNNMRGLWLAYNQFGWSLSLKVHLSTVTNIPE